MKIASKQFEQNLKQGKIEAFPKVSLIFGDDSGLARSLANRLVKLLTKDDDLAIEKISALNIIDDQSYLYDVVFSVSMFSDIKVVLIEDFINLGQKQRKLNDILAGLLEEQDKLENTYVIIPAVGLEASTSIVKKFEKDKTAFSVRCFVDSNFDLKKVVSEFFNEKGKTVEPKALMYLQNSLGNDRLVTMQELEKLDIYTLNESKISLQDCLDCIVSADSVNLFKFCDAVGMQDRNNAQKYLISLEEEGFDYNMIISVLVRHLKRLLIVKSAAGKNKSTIASEMSKLRPPVFFGKDLFEKQAENLSTEKLENIVLNFFNLQKDLRLNSQNAKSLVEKEIFNL